MIEHEERGEWKQCFYLLGFVELYGVIWSYSKIPPAALLFAIMVFGIRCY